VIAGSAGFLYPALTVGSYLLGPHLTGSSVSSTTVATVQNLSGLSGISWCCPEKRRLTIPTVQCLEKVVAIIVCSVISSICLFCSSKQHYRIFQNLKVVIYWFLLGSRMLLFDWYWPRWPWMTLIGVITIILRIFSRNLVALLANYVTVV